jgi:hypothetical protein
MEVNQFDTLTRSLTAAGSRRRALALALGGLISLGPVRSDDVAAGGKCKPKCPECKQCKKGKNGKTGKCKPKPNGTACSVGSCQKGSCAAVAPQSPPPPPPQPQSPPCGAGGPCRVFLSSATYDGNLGGLSGADAKCQGLATAAGLPGIYKAWLSDDTSAPSTRFVPSSGPYQLITGTPIAANFTDLTDGTVLELIRVTEKGGGTGTTIYAWTNTKSDGTRDSTTEHCANWGTNAAAGIGDVGSALLSDFRWTKANISSCNSSRHLYCFQQS